MKKYGLDDEVSEEHKKAKTSAWVISAEWPSYLGIVLNKLRDSTGSYRETLAKRIVFFELVARELPLPWVLDCFNSLEKRRIIGGMGPYGWLGHVAASGRFRGLLASRSVEKHEVIVQSINTLAGLDYPIDQPTLKSLLDQLVSLGPSMKVWSRLLTIIKPALFCTISLASVRKNLAKLFQAPEKHFETVEGYLMLIQFLHSSPWFSSSPPLSREERWVWDRRMAFIDVVLYKQ